MVGNFVNITALGLAFIPVGLGIFLSNKILKTADLTCEASFGLGGSIYGIMVIFGVSPVFAMIVAMLLGFLSGIATAFLINHIKLRVIVSSIITACILQNVILKIHSLREISFLTKDSLLGQLPLIGNLTLSILIVSACSYMIFRLMNSEYGLSFRIFGSGRIVTESLGINSNGILNMGLGFSNALCALAGALVVQITGEFQIGIGNGCLIFGLAAIKLGERLIRPDNIKSAICGCMMGSFILEMIIRFFSERGVDFISDEYRCIVIAITLMFLTSIHRSKQDLTKENT
ncbi:MAG: hypothetical protein E7015_03255 [Alphaproteobacteria bacterium]|nr:hypothetical protein [Alphaproteobacteria bacterium]